MLGRVALLVLLGAGALAVTVAWGWTALLVYGFCTFAAAAQAPRSSSGGVSRTMSVARLPPAASA